jgi:hypothetical protein
MLIEAVLQERRKILSEMESKGHPARLPHSGRADHGRAHADRIAAAGRTDRFPDRHEDRFAGHHPQERGGRRALEHHQCAGGPQRLSRHHRDVKKRHPTARINGVSIEPYLARPNGRELMIGVVARSDLWPDHHFRRRRHRGRGFQRPGRRPAAAEPLPGARPDPLRRAPRNCSASSATCRRSTSKRSKTCCCTSRK